MFFLPILLHENKTNFITFRTSEASSSIQFLVTFFVITIFEKYVAQFCSFQVKMKIKIQAPSLG